MSLFSEIKQSPIMETQPEYQAFIARCHEPQNYHVDCGVTHEQY